MTLRQRDRPKILSADYLVGLTDGEGCFYINLRPSKSRKSTLETVEMHFYLKLTADHLPLLNKVKETFGCGAVYRQREKRANHSECYRFEINSRKDIHQVLLPFFDQHCPQGPKKRDYQLFRQVAVILFGNKSLSKTDIEQIKKLKAQMNFGVRRVWKIRSLGGNVKERLPITIRPSSQESR